jgi:hypothetical protein
MLNDSSKHVDCSLVLSLNIPTSAVKFNFAQTVLANAMHISGRDAVGRLLYHLLLCKSKSNLAGARNLS